MTTKAPRVVVVTRETEYQLLLARHATFGQAKFFLETRGQDIAEVALRHEGFEAALALVLATIPVNWRVSRVGRKDLPRFLFEPDDTVIAVGQDGLVANTAKYLTGQFVLGVNPAPDLYEGVLVPCPPGAVADLLDPATRRTAAVEARTMVKAALDDGQELLALNEIFLGHRTHQSARYRIALGDVREHQSSSGIIITTGTGATGWARSINRDRAHDLELPAPTDTAAAFFVREAWPSVATGTEITEGVLELQHTLEITSEMNENGVLFGDGIEDDYLRLDWGVTATIGVAERTLNLVRG
jgi:NAD kinase